MLEPGTVVGDKYRLEELIGQGGMATVWRATHTTLDRPVAVKFLQASEHPQSEMMEARFLREAKLAAKLRHRHVVDIVDFGVREEGELYMVMELLEGQSLGERMRASPKLTDWDLLEIIAMALSGLAAVHDAGILHRDVKPDNIYLVEDADGVFPKLLDFGISRGGRASTRLTQEGAILGTPYYMAPEQVRGKKDVDPRADLWSVGVILYEGFSGRMPFDSEHAGDLLVQVATLEPASLAELRPDLGGALCRIVERAMRKEPKDRFEDARAMREAIQEAMLSHPEIEGRPEAAVMKQSWSGSAQNGRIKVVSASVPPPSHAPTLSAVEPPPPAKVPKEALQTKRLPPLRPLAKRKKRGVGRVILGAMVLTTAGGYAAYAYDRAAFVEALRDLDILDEASPGPTHGSSVSPIAAPPHRGTGSDADHAGDGTTSEHGTGDAAGGEGEAGEIAAIGAVNGGALSSPPQHDAGLDDAGPGNTASGDAASGDVSPSDAASGDTAPDDTAPGETAPGETAPGETAPGDTAPGDTAPGDTGLRDAGAEVGTKAVRPRRRGARRARPGRRARRRRPPRRRRSN